MKQATPVQAKSRINHLLPTETSPEVKTRGAVHAVLPVGSFEQHGAHLPLITDTVVAGAIARELGRAYPLLVLPPITISCSHEHHAWPGTVSMSAGTLARVIEDVHESLTRSGLSSLTIISGHGGNYVLANVVQEGTARGRKMALFPSRDDWQDARRSAGLVTSGHEDMHAGELETSVLLHVNPELVRDGYQDADWIADDRRHLLSVGLRSYTTSGVIGRPSLASAEKGKAILSSLIRNFAAVMKLQQDR